MLRRPEERPSSEAGRGTSSRARLGVRAVARPVDSAPGPVGECGPAAGISPAPGVRQPAGRSVLQLYAEADVIVSSPGGFLHDHYAIDDRLRGFEVALSLGRPVIVFAQSVGPFWKPESRRRVRAVVDRLSAICVRDAASVRYLAECGVAGDHVHQTADAAFLWRGLAPELFQPRAADTPVHRVAPCFRAWPLGDPDAREAIVLRAVRLARHILARPERTIGFVSTCQGIPGYIDDSVVAADIVARLSPAERRRCTVDRDHRGPRDLMTTLAEYDAFAGMRLHGCLLSMLAGVPAFGLGYEDKTEEIFGQLGFGEFQVHSREQAAAWIAGFDRFVAGIPDIRGQLPERLDAMQARAESTFVIVAPVIDALGAATG